MSNIKNPPLSYEGQPAGAEITLLVYTSPNDAGEPARVTLRKCYTRNERSFLYCDRTGNFFHLRKTPGATACRYILTAVKPNFSPYSRRGTHSVNGIHGSCYPVMVHFDGKHCHHLMAEAWLGPRPEGLECDHLNGNKEDWSADNLQWVTPEENRRRAKILRILRSCGRDPKRMTRDELLAVFNHYTFVAPAYVADPEAQLSQIISNNL